MAMEDVIAASKKVKIAHGSWRETSLALCATEFKAGTQIVGTCGACGAVVAAVNLRLKRLPFGRGERWQCKEGECS